ncbi:MAG: glycine--tRNA ligase subunit beta [Halomonadaceae bacterium]|nr:MAG: glycine--tRNA ligase subunit beta [Halomonadaceae bacterium]
MSAHDFLVEIGTEELPPKALLTLSNAFTEGVSQRLTDAGLTFSAVVPFAAPRRLAIRVEGLNDAQPDKPFERRGPAVKAAFDAAGNPTKALQGFASSLGITPDDLDTMETPKGAWLVYRGLETGRDTVDLLPAIVQESLAALPIPKRMRWGAHREEFVRPVHWVLMLFGSNVVECEVLGRPAGHETRGHRFHHPASLLISTPADYELVLEQQGYVLADFARRRELIRQGVQNLAKERVGGEAVIDPDLLDEVTALNEWPVPLLGKFEERFLNVPPEALISSMKEHQKYFHVLDQQGRMLPCFITVANIESKNPQSVIEGNEKVIRPRLSDAAFFYETDLKTPLADRVDQLKPIVFQKTLGSIHDKSERVATLAGRIAEAMNGDPALAQRAARLAKTDLVTEMVLEFTDLQGIMGQYYARHDGEPEELALALNEQYLPRFAGDAIPTTDTGAALALADRLDSLVGLFGINQPPTGTRDPFALRRAALGVLRIIVERQLPLDLDTLCHWAEAQFNCLTGTGTVDKVVDYLLERFRAGYEEQGMAAEVFLAVNARRPTRPLDFHQRMEAVNSFRQLPEAQALAAANKRVANILSKQKTTTTLTVEPASFQDSQEKALFQALLHQEQEVQPLFEQGHYDAGLRSLAQLQQPIDDFFDTVMVMADDPALRDNRLALLQRVRALFLQVADIGLLPSGNAG